MFFPQLRVIKPKSSRNSSIEAFIVGQNYSPKSYIPKMIEPMKDERYGMENPLHGPDRILVPFLAVGDLSGFDSDRTYALEMTEKSEYTYHSPVQVDTSFIIYFS